MRKRRELLPTSYLLLGPEVPFCESWPSHTHPAPPFSVLFPPREWGWVAYMMGNPRTAQLEATQRSGSSCPRGLFHKGTPRPLRERGEARSERTRPMPSGCSSHHTPSSCGPGVPKLESASGKGPLKRWTCEMF